MPVPSPTQGLVRIATFFGGAACLAGLFRFPGLVCQHGGGAFFIAYTVSLAVVVRPLLRAFRSLEERACAPSSGVPTTLSLGDKTLAWIAASLATLVGVGMTLISGWSLALSGKLASGLPASDQGKTFETLSGQAAKGALWTRETAGALPWLAVVVALVFVLSQLPEKRCFRLLRPALPLALPTLALADPTDRHIRQGRFILQDIKIEM